MRTVTHQQITWHDDSAPTEKDLRDLQKQHGFHDLDIEDCLSEHERPKIEEYDHYLFLVFHIPYINQKTGRIVKEEINVFFGHDFIVTLHEGKSSVIDTLWKELHDSRAKRDQYLQLGTGYFLYELMSRFFDTIFPLVDTITKKLREIEGQLFESEEEVDLLRDIMALKRNIITMRAILLPQRTLLGNLEHKNQKFVPEELTIYFDDILDAIERQWALLETSKEMIDALHGTHESWLSHKTNAVIRILTIFSVIMLPLTFLTGLYGMNVRLPFGENPSAFELILVLMGLVVCGMFLYFWKKRWI